jgi:hypothetical protein
MSDIEKLSVFSPQIVQERPRYAVRKGPLSTTTQPFHALSNSTAQMTFNVQVPSLNVFVDREVLWESEMVFNATVSYATAPTNTNPLLVFGRNVAFANNPLHRLCTTQTATINDCVVSLNTQDCIDELQLLTNSRVNRSLKTCPSMLDTYKYYNDGVGSSNTPIASYYDAPSNEDVPNGAYWDVQFVDTVTGVPIAPPVGDGTKLSYDVSFKIKCTEKVMISPFIFAEEHGDEVGLYGINNINFVFNFRTALAAKIIRIANELTIDALSLKEFNNSKLWCTFYTPSLEVALPPKSIVPYYNISRYISKESSGPAQATALIPIQKITAISQTITLPCIPDFIMVYAKRSSADDVDRLKEADFYFPITKVSVNFDNFSGLLSSTPNQVLYRYACETGLTNMSWNMWNGAAKIANPTGTPTQGYANNVPLRGCPLALAFGRHITLQSGLAPGVVGNYTFQIECEVTNADQGADYSAQPVNLYVLAFESGFCETSQGSTRLIRGPLTETDVISAPPADHTTFTQLERYVGGGLFSKLGTALNKVKSALTPVFTDPAVRQTVKDMARKHGGKYGNVAADIASVLGMGARSGGGVHTGGRKARLNALM